MNYCPRCGARLEERFLHGRYRPTCTSCGFVVYLDPKVGVGVVLELNGQVVMVRRAMEPHIGAWALPSGFVEHDESAEDAAVRETREETGLEVALDDLLGVYSFGTETGSRGVLILYSAHVVGGELRAGDDATEVRLFAPEVMPEDIAFMTHRQALRDWVRAKAVIYREASPEDARAVGLLRQEYREEIGSYYLTHDRAARRVLHVAADKQVVVGFAEVVIQEINQAANITQIFVLPNYRRWGIATRLVERSLDHARQLGLRTMLAEAPASNPALLVYLKSGFRVCGFFNTPSAMRNAAGDSILFLANDLA